LGPFDESWLIATVALTAPLLFAALGEMISERSGVINVGLEGMMLVGAFAAFLVAWETGSVWLGVAAGVAGGLAVAAVMALVSVNGGGDQIVAGLGLFIVGGGLTVYANQEIFADEGRASVDPMAPVGIPGLEELPGIGEAFFNQTPLVYLAYLAVPLVYVLLWRTPWGLAIRAVGERPEAAEVAGIKVSIVRWFGVLAAGIGGGLAGALLTVGSIGIFNDGISSGRGFIAIAAVVFGRWRPLGVLAACLVFGAADALQLRLQAIGEIPREVWLAMGAIAIAVLAWRLRRPGGVPTIDIAIPGAAVLTAAVLFVIAPSWQLPAQIWLMLPYVVTLLVLAGLLGRTRLPSALGVPYGGVRSEA
jgi:general nucleoside transport system permease protein